MIIKFYVEEQAVQLKSNKVVASDTVNFVELNFTFCDCWKDYNKTVQFTQQTSTYSVNLGTTGSKCYLPAEITDGLCAISIFGTNEDKRITTIPCQIRIKRSGFMEDSIAPEDTQLTVIEQLIEQTEKNTDDINSLKGTVEGQADTITKLDEKITENTNKANEALDRVGTCEEYLGTIPPIKEAVDTLEESVGDLTNTVSGITTSINGINQTNTSQQQAIEENAADIFEIKNRISGVGATNCLADVFDAMFGTGYTQDGITATYDKSKNEFTLNGETTEEVRFGKLEIENTVYLDMGYYSFSSVYNGSYFMADGSVMPFHIGISPYERGATGLYIVADRYEIKHREQAGTRSNGPDYNVVDHDVKGILRLIIPANSKFEDKKFYPYLYRYANYNPEV